MSVCLRSGCIHIYVHVYMFLSHWPHLLVQRLQEKDICVGNWTGNVLRLERKKNLNWNVVAKIISTITTGNSGLSGQSGRWREEKRIMCSSFQCHSTFASRSGIMHFLILEKIHMVSLYVNHLYIKVRGNIYLSWICQNIEYGRNI